MGARKTGIQLSATQIVASVLAAVTATVAGSFLGVNGTIIGAAVASLLTVVGNAVYGHYLHRTRERVRTVPAMRRIGVPPAASPASLPTTRVAPMPPAGVSPPAPTAPLPAVIDPRSVVRAPVGRARWRRAGLAAVGVFVALLALLTSVEVVSGRPLSDLLHGTSGSGTTIFGSSRLPDRTSPAPVPRITVTQTVVPKVITTTPTVTQTAPAVTVTPSPAPSSSTGATGGTSVPGTATAPATTTP